MTMKDSPSPPAGTTASAGYSMIEVLIAIAIFSIGIMAMGALQASSLMATGEIARKTEAWAMLEDQAETLKSLPFYLTITGLDENNDGTTDTTTAHPAALIDNNGIYSAPSTPDGRFSINWQVEDNVPIIQQDAADLSSWRDGLPAGNYTVSKTVTVWVTRSGTAAQADALATVEFVKTLWGSSSAR